MMSYENQQRHVHVYDDIEGIKSRSMKDNIIFHFHSENENYKEPDGEDIGGLVGSFLSNVMGIKSNIHVQSAHRLGAKIHNKQRPIIIRIPNGCHRSIIFHNASRLHDKPHYITHQIPPFKQEKQNTLLRQYSLNVPQCC